MGDFEHMVDSYIKERYGDELKVSAEDYIKALNEQDIFMSASACGFVTFHMAGDSAIIYDMYVKPEFRNKGHAWKLFEIIQKVAKSLKKRYILTFSEQAGKNHSLGLSAINAAGFKQYGTVGNDKLFIRGV